MVNLNTIIEYIRNLSPDYKHTLYTSLTFTTSIIKIFDDSTIRLIFDLLLTAPSVKSLQKNENIKNSLKILLRLQLITKKGSNIFLNEKFRETFLKGAELINNKEYFQLIGQIDGIVTVNKKFEEILNFLVNKENITKNPFLIEVLIDSKLINNNQDINNNGFEFLLKPRYEQYWFLVIAALKYFCKDEKIQLNNFMSIIEMSNISYNAKYKIIKPIDKNLYTFLSDIGILSINNDILIIHHNLFVKHDSEKTKFLLLETNFKLYAYTTSTYEKSIIQLFTDVYLILPNLIKGILTEKSLSNAFSRGVTSQQLINFLQTYSLFEDVPETVLNQLEIWESNRKRIKVIPGYLYSNFLNLVDYQNFIKFCYSKDCIVDKDDERRMAIIKIENNEIVKDYLKSKIN